MATKNEFYKDFSNRRPYNDVPCKDDDLSLNQMMDDINDPDKNAKDPTGTTMDEDIALFYIALDMLIEYYHKCQQPRKANCFKMLIEGYNKQEIAEQITPELRKSRSYEFIQQTQKEGLQVFRNQFHLK